VDRQGTILLANPQTEKLFGYSREELLGQSITMLVPERFRNSSPVAWMGFGGVPEARPTGTDQELSGLHKDGNEVPVDIGVTPIDTAEGALTLVTIIDLSEQKHSAEALAHVIREGEVEREREGAFLRQIIDTDPNFIFAKDRQGRFTLANRAVADAYGTTVENLIGRTDAELNPNREEVEAFRRDDLEVLDPPPPIGAVFLRQLLIDANDLRIGSIADRVGGDLESRRRSAVGQSEHLGVGVELQPAGAGAVGIGLLKPGTAGAEGAVGE